MLSSFDITNFRTFSSLHIKRLGRVNLIVGKNNVGKTMLLEALRLYALGGNPAAIRQLLLQRDEFIPDPAQAEAPDAPYLRLEALFHRNYTTNQIARSLTLGPHDEPNKTVRIGIRYLLQKRTEQGTSFVPVSDKEIDNPNVIPGLSIYDGTRELTVPYHYITSDTSRRWARSRLVSWPAFVTARGVSDREVARWWDSVALKEGEERVKECLKIITAVDRINFVEEPHSRTDRVAMVRLAGDSQPIPLKSLGDGMSRIFQISLALECTKPTANQTDLFPDLSPWSAPLALSESFLLIDEIENGIHYTVHADLWRFITRVARHHGIQVFATSHSWDSILGLREAVKDDPDADATIVRLEAKGQTTKAVLFEQDEFEIIARNATEVR